MSIEPLFRCPTCAAEGLAERDNAAVCAVCGSRFPIIGGIALLVKEPAAHDAAIRDAQAVNPEWYLTEQPPEEASPWRHHLRKRRRYVERVLRRELDRRGWKKAGRLLDLGCGDGNNLRWLAPFAERLYGSDYNLARLTRARACSPATLFLADVLNYPVLSDSFDVIFFNHVIEHIPDDMAALSAVYRILKPGGLLVLGAPNEGAWWWQLAYRRAPDILATTDHVHFYTAQTIGQKMNAAGFSVFEVEHMGWGPPDFRLDGQWRRHKVVDDLFELLGRALIPRQASSLYLMATKHG